MDPLLTIGEHFDAIAKIIGGVLAIIGFWVWGIPKVKCAWKRIRSVWSALEQLPAAITYLSTDNPDGVPAKFTQVLDQGEARGQQLIEHGGAIARVDKKIDGVVNTQRASMNSNPRIGAFDADSEGRYTVVNRTLMRWTGLAPSELLGLGWLNAVHALDRSDVRSEWFAAIKECRRFEKRFRLINAASQAVTEVDASADPIPENTIPCERWFGVMHIAQSGAP